MVVLSSDRMQGKERLAPGRLTGRGLRSKIGLSCAWRQSLYGQKVRLKKWGQSLLSFLSLHSPPQSQFVLLLWENFGLVCDFEVAYSSSDWISVYFKYYANITIFTWCTEFLRYNYTRKYWKKEGVKRKINSNMQEWYLNTVVKAHSVWD